MGTNYYADTKHECPTCGHREGRLHIGKSSMGWRFLFAAYPDKGIETAADWKKHLARPGVEIYDEYGVGLAASAFWKHVDKKQSSPANDDQFARYGGRERFEVDDPEGYRISRAADFS